MDEEGMKGAGRTLEMRLVAMMCGVDASVGRIKLARGGRLVGYDAGKCG